MPLSRNLRDLCESLLSFEGRPHPERPFASPSRRPLILSNCRPLLRGSGFALAPQDEDGSCRRAGAPQDEAKEKSRDAATWRHEEVFLRFGLIHPKVRASFGSPRPHPEVRGRPSSPRVLILRCEALAEPRRRGR